MCSKNMKIISKSHSVDTILSTFIPVYMKSNQFFLSRCGSVFERDYFYMFNAA